MSVTTTAAVTPTVDELRASSGCASTETSEGLLNVT